MTRNQAARLVTKLRALTTERGATGPEAALAAEKADALIARFGLADADVRVKAKPRPQQARPAPPAGFADWVGGFAQEDFIFGGAQRPWAFDSRTGQASPNVKVHQFKDRRNWRIEVLP